MKNPTYYRYQAALQRIRDECRHEPKAYAIAREALRPREKQQRRCLNCEAPITRPKKFCSSMCLHIYHDEHPDPTRTKARQRSLEALALREGDKSFREIGEHFGICKERAAQLVRRGQWWRRRLVVLEGARLEAA